VHNIHFSGVSAAIAEHSQELGVRVDKERLEAILSQALTITTDLPVSPLLDLHAQLCRIVHSHSMHLDRSKLPQVIIISIILTIYSHYHSH
jgi:hypothetical protein